jgi:hypothetical protein
MSWICPRIRIKAYGETLNAPNKTDYIKYGHTTSRILAQPIYRDALLLGKFLASLSTLALLCTVILLLIFGMGILRMGVAPGAEEVGRGLVFLLATICYGASGWPWPWFFRSSSASRPRLHTLPSRSGSRIDPVLCPGVSALPAPGDPGMRG